jgi:hypothetical protein
MGGIHASQICTSVRVASKETHTAKVHCIALAYLAPAAELRPLAAQSFTRGSLGIRQHTFTEVVGALLLLQVGKKDTCPVCLEKVDLRWGVGGLGWGAGDGHSLINWGTGTSILTNYQPCLPAPLQWFGTTFTPT